MKKPLPATIKTLTLSILWTVSAARALAQQVIDGSLDPGFGSGGEAVVSFDLGDDDADHGRALALQADGRILVAGTVAMPGPSLAALLVRLMPDGSLDPTYGTAGRVVVASDCLSVNDVTSETGDRLYLTVTMCTGQACSVRVDADGSVDSSFGTDGFACLGSPIYSAVTTLVDPDGSVILVANAPATQSVTLVRFDSTGAPIAYGGLSYGADDFLINPALLDADANILLAGELDDTGPGNRVIVVEKVHPDFTPDPTFGAQANGGGFYTFIPGGSIADRGLDIVVAANGDVLVGGSAETTSGIDAAVMRLDPNGLYPSTSASPG
jgi:uncharacterized delta-60 repeat protein